MRTGGTARPAAGGGRGGRGLGGQGRGLLGLGLRGFGAVAVGGAAGTLVRAGGVRLLLGTGFLGALTTYGTLAGRAAEGLRTAPVMTVVELLALLAAGVLAAGAGAPSPAAGGL